VLLCGAQQDINIQLDNKNGRFLNPAVLCTAARRISINESAAVYKKAGQSVNPGFLYLYSNLSYSYPALLAMLQLLLIYILLCILLPFYSFLFAAYELLPIIIKL
jgi:hypothetical protein